MAKYKRQKVKRYRRSFYSRGTRIKKGIGIVVLVLAVLGAAWLAAPHVLDWATHTWYTVVKNRDLEAESASRAAASSEAAASSAVQEAASSQPEPEQPKELDGKAITGGILQGHKAVIRSLRLETLKDADGSIHYASQVAAASGSIAGITVDPARIAAIFREEGIIPAAQLAAFTDPVSGYTDRSMAVHYSGTQLWLDNVSAKAGGKSWLDPSAASAVQYVGDLIEELHGMGFEQVVLTGVQFPNIITRKQEFAAAGGKSQEGRAALLAADISTWQARFDGSVVLWLSYPAQQCTDASDALGAPAVSLGMHNLIVTADTLDAAARGQLQQSAAEAGVQNVVICSTESFQ